MNLMKAKYLALLCAFCAVLPGFAKEWNITRWSGGDKNARFTHALINSQDGDVLKLMDNITVNAPAELTLGRGQQSKKVTVVSTSTSTNPLTIFNKSYMHKFTIGTGTTLVMSNVTYDCSQMSQITDVFTLTGQRTSGQPVARMILENGATIKNAVLSPEADNENAVIKVNRGAVFTMRPGSAILNCKNNSVPGDGGAIYCDYGTVIITGGTIAGCTATGNGGAIYTTGTRVESVDGYHVNERGDIYISGGYITNNTCGTGKLGGGIYLGNTGPLLNITGTTVISNNLSGTVADDVSTYELKDTLENRLKLVDYHSSHPEGFTYAGQLFTGWVGVRYPDSTKVSVPEGKQFGGVWEYFNGIQEEARNFYWNGDNSYRGKIEGNSLIWSKHVIHELPKDGQKVAELIASGETPIYMELSSDYKMEQPAVVPENMELILDLKGFNLECDFHISNETARVTIFDSSTNKSGTVTGHRDSEYPNSFCLQGGSYAMLPKPEWVASNCVVIGNYCEHHPYMVASKVWDADHARTVTDLTMIPFDNSEPGYSSTKEVREGRNEDNTLTVSNITYSTGDWKFMQYTNQNYHVRVLAVPAVSNETTGVITEVGDRVVIFNCCTRDTTTGYGNEGEFVWDEAARSYGLIKLIHITLRYQGNIITTNAEEVAYFRFPEARFMATQRKPGVGQLGITLGDELLSSLNFNRADGFLTEDDVNNTLDKEQVNGLRRWENIVTGTDENQLLLSTVSNDGNGLSLNVALTDANKQGRTDTGYTVKYDIRKSTDNGWERVGEIMDEPRFSVPLLGENGASVGASGFYRITTLIIPDGELSVTNEIPSTNIVGVLEVASKLANTLAAVPWTALATDPSAQTASPVAVSDYVHTPHLGMGDSVQVADKGHIYRYWQWGGQNSGWQGATTITKDSVVPETSASEHSLERNSAVWVTRGNPAERPFFLIGQYSSEKQTLKIEAGTEDNPVCTLVPNPCLTATKVNAYNWGEEPHEKDIIRIPNEKTAPIALRWDASRKEWGRLVKSPNGRGSVWSNAAEVPAGTGFWYMRCGGEFEITLPASAPVAE